MPRVVPSQITEIIDQFKLDIHRTIGRDNTAHLTGLLAPVEQLPSDLLILSASDYSLYVVAVEELKSTLAKWVNGIDKGYGLSPRTEFEGVNAVGLIRRVLALCPDQSPASASSDLASFCLETAKT